LQADEKRARRLEPRDADPAEAGDTVAPPTDDVLSQIAKTQAAFDNDEISFDEYEDRKSQLLASLVIE
jgi:hypothetical protein